MKSRKTIFRDFLLAAFIMMVSFLPYIHDFDLFKGMKGFSGFSSLRVAMWSLSLYIVGLSGWVMAFVHAKDRSYRFAMLAPIFMCSFQMAIYLFDARNTSSNDFTFKTVLNFIFCGVVLVLFFYNKKKQINEGS